MKRKTLKRILTAHVVIDTRLCIACWKCMDRCPNRVIGRVNLPWHKHILLRRSENCTGCGRCIETCPAGVFRSITSKIPSR